MSDYNNPGECIAIDVNSSGVPYVVNSQNYVFYLTGHEKPWQQLPILATDIAVGGLNVIYAISPNAEIESPGSGAMRVTKWDDNDKRFILLEPEAMRISTNPAGDLVWLVQQDNTLLKGTLAASEFTVQAMATA